MATRTLTAMFKTRGEAERAEQALASELGLDRSTIQTSPGTGVTDAGYDPARPYEEKGFFASLKNLMLPEEDRYAYAEGMRRGAVLLNVKVDEGQIDRASDVLEHNGAMDLDAQETEWRKSGWTGYDATAHGTLRGAAAGTTPAVADRDETLQVVEEKLVVGKRAVEGGRVRVRSYVVETPVEENVTLHQERVTVERHPVDRAATDADLAAFQERTIEARATNEEAVVSKETRIVEEIGVRKEAADRVETVRDTVRKTQVDVEDGTAGRVGAAPAGTTTTGTTTTGTTHGGAPTGTGAAASVDRTLNTNVSGTNPGANAPDGTGSNPPGTMASRAVDKTLGTNISGANPERK